MSKTLIKEFYRTIQLDDLSISYSGKFTDSMTEKIIDLSEAYLDKDSKLSSLKRRTSFLVAECFQNVVRHSPQENEHKQTKQLEESFFLRFYENRCFIASENLIPNEFVNGLRSKLDLVNTYETKELRNLYRTILDEGELSDEGGAGLGLIEMARKTGNKLMYSFDRGDEKVSHFYLMLVLENAEEVGPISDYQEDLMVIKQIIKNVQKDNIFVLYKGDFEKEITEHIEHIIENNLDDQPDPLATKVKLFNAAIMTMNILGDFSMKEGDKHKGMMFIARTEDGYGINATFPVGSEKQRILDEILGSISNSSIESLQEEYQQKLTQSTRDQKQTPELGFLQLALMSRSLDHEFDLPAGQPGEVVIQLTI